MFFVIQLMYTLTIFIMVAACTVNMTVRLKNLTAISSISKQKSTSFALVLVLAFNLIDYLIVSVNGMGFKNAVTAMYILENILEIAIVYVIIWMGREYKGKTQPRSLEGVFLLTMLMALCGDGFYAANSESVGDIVYALYMAGLNMIPIVILAVNVFSFWRHNKGGWKLNFADTYILIYSIFCIMLAVAITCNTIDSRTSYNFFVYDNEIYISFWLVFNIYNFIFVWKTLSVDDRTEAERIQSPEEKIRFLAEKYLLSQREIEIAQRLYEGKNNKEIAAELYLSLNTIKAHASNLYKKLGVANRIQAVQIIRGDGVPTISSTVNFESERQI